ncbi:ABC transporter ATP-binding protein [Demequina flava]|uniref:ABC transporter ATP-binding protein n=1 Tax=Demequina flava TaxID=1095025 RepID=UPI0007823B2C|nr:ABC transporter ATP-binding protein [Demequina flava]
MSDSTKTPHLDVTDMVAGYLPEIDIVRECSIHADDGELVGIIGPNGAGKSTLLKAIFGLVPVRSGTVKLSGEDVTNRAADKLVASGMAFVPQSDNVFGPMTVRENLQLGTHLQRNLFGERIDKVLGILPELKPMLNARAGSLSGGERQIAAMGRALMSEPSVLLLDEPSAGLSPARQDEAFLRIHDIRSAGVCVVIVEQNARRCLQICDRAYVLDQGTDAHEGSGEDLLHDPKVVSLYLGDLGVENSGAEPGAQEETS